MNEQNETTAPPHVALQQMLMAGWLSKAISVSSDLQIADHLANGPRSAQELAQATGTDATSLHRLMRALSSVGVFAVDESGHYTHTPVSELLRSDTPGSLHGMSRLFGHTSHWAAWENLEHSVRTGAPAFDHTFGADFFTYAAQNPETQTVFNTAMTSIATSVHSTVAHCYDFSGIETLLDVGGGHGSLISAILTQNPAMKGILFDLPHVVAGAGELLVQRGTSERVETVGGNFFESLPNGADAVIMSMVIHDWDDERSIKILRNCHQALKPGGKVLLVEMVVPNTADPSPAKFMDLNMLVMTPGGRERTQSEYNALYEKSGFKLTHIVSTPSPISVVEGIRID
jgi:SAM-dependent methyltransferase